LAKIAFAVPHHSASLEFLEGAVRSALRQTVGDVDVVICDNAGPGGDRSPWVAGLRDPRVRYFRNAENVGMAGNWNLCLERAGADLVTLLHDDDELEPWYAETMLAAASRHPEAAALFCRARVVDLHGRAIFSFADWYKRLLVPSGRGEVVLEAEPGLAAVLRGNFIMCPTLCYRRGKLGSMRFRTDLRMAPDLALIGEMLLGGLRIVGVRKEAYLYRRHGGSGTAAHTADLSRFSEEAAVVDEIGRRARGVGWTRAARVAERKLSLRLHVLYLATGDLLRGRLGAAITKVRRAIRLRAS